MLSTSPYRFSTQNSQYQNWKANKYSILTVTVLRPPVLKSSARFQNVTSLFYSTWLTPKTKRLSAFAPIEIFFSNTGCNKSTAEAWISFCYLNFRHDTCYEQGVPWHSDKYKARRDNNIEEFHIFTKIKNTDGWK